MRKHIVETSQKTGRDWHASSLKLLFARGEYSLPVSPTNRTAVLWPSRFRQQVWRSIREWDSHSIELLNEYLHAAREAVREKQSRLGVPVHVRLGGGEGTGDADQQRDSAGSYAVWAVTHCRDHRGVARVACSEMAQTEVPRSAIQRVQVNCSFLVDV